MKTIKNTILALTLLMLTTNTFAQQKTWTTPPKKWNMTTTTPTSTALPGGASAYSVANGAYDEAGNLLFYVQDEGIYGDAGDFVEFLPIYQPGSDCIDAYSMIDAEIAIVPIPGACKSFYVIYGLHGLMSPSNLFYIKVDCSSGSPIITFDNTVYVMCWGDYVPSHQPFKIDNHGGTFNVAFAVSKVYTNSSATAKRFLLSVSAYGIVRSEISSSGISAGTLTNNTTLGLTAHDDFNGYEAEISWGSNYFAWSSSNGKVFTITLTSSGFYNNTVQTYTLSGAKGIEFSNSTGNPYLYVAAASDLKRINTSNQTYTSFSWGSGNDLSHTFLEYGKNGRIYGVSPIYSGSTLTGSKLIPIVSTSVLTAVTADIDSRYASESTSLYGIFTLPDQIDGEDYTYFNGLPKVTLTNFTLNSNVVSNVCDNGTDKYCKNAAITFNVTYSGGTPDQYNLDDTSLWR